METNKIWYQGVQYPVVEVTIFSGTNDEDVVLVSSIKLENRLMDDMQAGLIEALEIDERFAAYINEEEFDLSEDEIVKIVEGFY